MPDLERMVALCAAGTLTKPKLCALVQGQQLGWKILVTRFRCNFALLAPDERTHYREGRECALLEQAAKAEARIGAAMQEKLWSQNVNWNSADDTDGIDPPEGMVCVGWGCCCCMWGGGRRVRCLFYVVCFLIHHQDAEADSARKQLAQVEEKLQEVLREAEVTFDTRDVFFKAVGRHSYLIDVPAARQHLAPPDFELVNSTKTRYRYLTPRVKELLVEMDEINDSMRARRFSWFMELQARFAPTSSSLYCFAFALNLHSRAAQLQDEVALLASALAHLDCLLSLAAFVDAHADNLSRPIVLPRAGKQSFFEATRLRHPIDLLRQGQISNDVILGAPSPTSTCCFCGFFA